jgi:hypothetical protein
MASRTVVTDILSYNLTRLFEALIHQITSQITPIPSKISNPVAGIKIIKAKKYKITV